ncbi:MAG: hypothetical protein V1815_00515 [Candidatus Woesearchaeota archaeon]
MNIRFLNKKEIKDLLDKLDLELKNNYVFIKKNNEFYIVSNDIKSIDFSDLNMKSMGLLFAKYKDNKLVLNDDIKDLSL